MKSGQEKENQQARSRSHPRTKAFFSSCVILTLGLVTVGLLFTSLDLGILNI